MRLGRDWYNRSEMKVGEIHFHQYDSLEDDIMDLYTDDMHTTLRSDVTKETIDALETRLETPDEESGEVHPLYKELKLELKTANEILGANLSPAYEVINEITAAKDTHLGFTGLNAWQPLGRVADEGETLIVYVGHNTKQTGQNADLQLVFTQYHAESDSLVKTVNLKVGKNEITVPSITNNNFERGGQIYIAYTGNSTSDQYGVCINGGTKIPVLNLYKKTGEERTAAIQKYIEDLEEYNSTSIETKHEAHTKGNAEYSYDEKNCIYNATDIMLDQMMYSVPATKVWNNLSGSSDKVTQLENALDAMDQMMTLFYQHKGLSDSAGTSKGNNALPSEHLNIRYMRMFSGAFMYAAGNHIGIEWDSTNFVSSASSLDSFGWGIAHEIGHDINQSSYAVAEITNNYFAQLLTKAVNGTRFTYENVYDKVTSGATGRDSNLATQLAMYWQLHLAFDNNKDDRYIYDNYQDQFNNLFFARVDTYARNPGKAPQSGLTLGSDVDQNLMRLSCAAANKNILSFFRRWGMTPDADTIAYAAKYGEEDEKALYYVNDDARDYRADHADEAGTIKGQDVATATVSADGNQVKVTINTSADTNLILGYEIIRSITSNGETKSQVVGFQTIEGATTTFVDTIATMNNRVMSYEVKAVDKYLNYSNSTKAGSVKVETGGVLNKSAWTVETNLNSEDDTEIIPDAEDPDSGYSSIPSLLETKTVHSIDRVIDNSQDTVYHGTISGEAEITIDMHKVEEVTSLKYKGSSLAGVTVAVSENGSDWTTVKENYEGCTAGSSTYSTIWFDSVEEESRSNWIGTYNAQYVKLIIPQAGSVDINEIEICGPTGDNLEFQMSEDSLAVGILADDYQYGADLEDMIPQGSLVFTGTYKGNPAYNVVVLYDTDGNVIGSDGENVNAQQVIFADAPENGDLGETSDGTWVYYVTPENWDEDTISQIKGVRGELYRVDNALTLAGERIVSDTLIMDIPEILPDITLTGQKTTSEQ
jgi:hypothetical protein